MKEEEELIIRNRLIAEESIRNREKFSYTYDALPHLMTWPESHDFVRGVIFGDIDYDHLPNHDDEVVANETYKGIALPDQVKIVKANGDKEPLCEALHMQGCKREACPIYIAAGAKDAKGKVITTVPLCREFKMAFRKSSA